MKSSALAISIACSLLCVSTGVTAADQMLPFTVSTGYFGNQWNVSSSECATGLNIADAQNTTDSDAYDGGFFIFINGTTFQAPGNTVDRTGTVVTSPTAAMSGLNVRMQHKFMTGSQVVRVLVHLSNPTGGAIAVPVRMETNFGSDGSTQVQATSSGDLLVGTTDNWMVSSEGAPATDPVLTTVWGMAGAALQPTSVTPSTSFNCAGTQGVSVTHSLTVPAGQTRSLMYFGGLGGITAADNLIASATANASQFNSTEGMPAEWLSDLDNITRSQIVNISGGEVTTCASEGYTYTKLEWCKNICERGYTGSTLAMWIRRWTDRYRTLPYCAIEPQPE